MNRLVDLLFETKAVRVSPADRPFWYTSGTIGPFYINTHFLFDGEENANALLALIDAQKDDKATCAVNVLDALCRQYLQNGIFKEVQDLVIDRIKEVFSPGKYDYISGGERRDWFFSMIAAHILQKPHITIYKDLDAVIINPDGTVKQADGIAPDAGILHIVDLITEASSYERAWIPAVEKLGGRLGASLCVVDRNQGGTEFLKRRSIAPSSMITVDRSMFDAAFKAGYIDGDQHEMVINYMSDPKISMRKFLLANPTFIADTIAAGGGNAARAMLCKEKNIYAL